MPPAKLYEGLSLYIESMIASGGFAPGEKLPTQRALAAQFNLTQNAVCRALKDLAARGLLDLRQGSGCYVRRRVEHRGKYNFMVYTQSKYMTPTYCGRILSGMLDRAAELGIGLMLNFVDYPDFAGSPLREREADFDAVVLVGLYDNVLTEFFCRKPCVGVNMHRTFGCLSTLDMDPVAAADLAVGYLHRKSVRHAICITSPDFAHEGAARNVFDFRRQCFLAAWDGTSECVAPRESDDLTGFARLPAGTGLWFSGDTHCHRLFRGFQKQTGRDLAAAVPLISNNGRNRTDPSMFLFPTIAPDYRLMGRNAVDEAVRRVEQPGAPLMRLYQNVALFE